MAFRSLGIIILFHILLIHLALYTLAVPTNSTIDDQLGDSVSGALPVYSPQNVWTRGDQCTSCFAKPDLQQTFQHTWHDATWHPSQDELTVTMSFKGTAIYAYCILDNANTYTTFTNLTFSIDGSQVWTFSHSPDGSGSFQYNALVYSNTSIPDGNHTFVIRAPTGVNDSVVLFDYVQYTFDSPTPSSVPASTTSSSTTSSSTTTSSSPVPTPTPPPPVTVSLPPAPPSVTTSLSFVTATPASSSIPASTPLLSAVNKSSTPVGAIAGGAIGGVVIFVLLGIILFLCRRRRSGKEFENNLTPPLDATPIAYVMNPGTGHLDWGQQEPSWVAGQHSGSIPVSSQSHARSASDDLIPASARPSTFDPYTALAPESSATQPSTSQHPVQHQYRLLMASNPDHHLPSTSHYRPEKMGRGDLSLQLKDRQQQLAALESQRSVRHPTGPLQDWPTSSTSAPNIGNDPALETQVDELKREVERLREIVVDSGQAPPQYQD